MTAVHCASSCQSRRPVPRAGRPGAAGLLRLMLGLLAVAMFAQLALALLTWRAGRARGWLPLAGLGAIRVRA